jgi:3-mercaptopyruvate sulfurtransferase SseA
MFQCFGHEKCYILDGGFPAWVAAGFDVDSSFLSSELPAYSQVEYGTATGPVDIIDMQAVKANMENPQFQLVDARPYPRFTGDAPEPRPIKSGHLQDSFSVDRPVSLTARLSLRAPPTTTTGAPSPTTSL